MNTNDAIGICEYLAKAEGLVTIDAKEREAIGIVLSLATTPSPKGRVYGDPEAIEALSRNANRYLYIRDHMERPETGQPIWMRRGDDLDEAIDAVIEENNL